MKRRVSIASAIMLAAAAVIMMVIPQFLETPISDYRDQIAEGVTLQREAQRYMVLANTEYALAGLQQDHLGLMRSLMKDSEVLKEKEKAILLSRMQASLDSINAATAARKMTSDAGHEEVVRVAAMKEKSQLDAVYQKYFALAAAGTLEMDAVQTAQANNVKRLSTIKMTLWYSALVLQLLGFAGAVFLLAKEEEAKKVHRKA